MDELNIKLKFSKQMPEQTLRQLKEELVERQGIPEKLKGIFKMLDDGLEVSIEYG